MVSALPAKKPLHVVYCPRCDLALWRMRRVSFSFPLACGLAALFFYMSALSAPFLEISSYGRFQLARIGTGPAQLTSQGYNSVALLVFAVTMIFPGIKLAILLLTLIGIETRFLPNRLLKAMFRWYWPLSPWAMIDVYLLGFLVAYTRLTAIASVHLDTALFSLIGFMVTMAAADGSLDHETTWRALDHETAHAPETPAPPGATFIGCEACHLLNHALPGTECRRCHATLRAAQDQQHQPHLGAPERRGTALHSGQYLPGHDHHRSSTAAIPTPSWAASLSWWTTTSGRSHCWSSSPASLFRS